MGPHKQWRCRYCSARNGAGDGCCGSCGAAFIPNLNQILFQGQSSPQYPVHAGYTPIFKEEWYGKGAGKGGGKNGKGKGYNGGADLLTGQPTSQSKWRQSHQMSRKEKDAVLAAEFLRKERDGDSDMDSEARLMPH
jgi:hypothetical protein